ncbi:hypothetical protein Bbelb_172800 [Branchiostoma belcheri]|nr:hypothetical protein Bbelb_172800 [Branchiostoma belcheri]
MTQTTLFQRWANPLESHLTCTPYGGQRDKTVTDDKGAGKPAATEAVCVHARTGPLCLPPTHENKLTYIPLYNALTKGLVEATLTVRPGEECLPTLITTGRIFHAKLQITLETEGKREQLAYFSGEF